MPRTTDYVHATAGFESERARLRLLEARYDEGTFRRVDALQRFDGACCLEVGAGVGSVARWLAGRVGPGGRVVATDIDPRFLTDLDGSNVEVRRHDIVVDDLEEGGYDLVHCRALLLHLGDPRCALERMAEAVRPGGSLLVEDADYVSMVAADPQHPLSGAFDRMVQSMFGFARSAGLFDPWFGRRLPGLVASLDLSDVGHEATAAVRRGGSPEAQLLRQSTERLRGPVLAAGLVTEDEFEILLRTTGDPSFTFFDALSVAAWGRRPV